MRLLLIALLLSASAITVQAQTLRVEMVVFDRGERRGPETYPKRLDLSWPKAVRLLGEPPLPESGDELAEQSLEARPQPPPDVQWWPPLAVETLSLGDAAQRLRRHFGGRILLHAGWPLPPSGAVLFKSEQSAGERPVMMGYAHIKRGRYLALDTNLWVAEFEPNEAQPNEGWPALPRWPGEPEPLAPSSFAWTTDEAHHLAADADATGDAPREDDLPLFSHEPYRVVKIVQLKESRRLKMDELNYLDHPRLGVLIKVTEDSGAAASDSGPGNQAGPR